MTPDEAFEKWALDFYPGLEKDGPEVFKVMLGIQVAESKTAWRAALRFVLEEAQKRKIRVFRTIADEGEEMLCFPDILEICGGRE